MLVCSMYMSSHKKYRGCTKLQKHFYKNNAILQQHCKLWQHSSHRALTMSTIMECYGLLWCSIIYCMFSYMFVMCAFHMFLNVKNISLLKCSYLCSATNAFPHSDAISVYQSVQQLTLETIVSSNLGLYQDLGFATAFQSYKF